MMFARILTLIVLLSVGGAQAQAQGDDQVIDAYQAWKQGNRAKLAQLLPQVQGHPLEAWVAYWELRSRLDTAAPQEVQDFFTKYAGTYQEDRLRNDWLLLLGQRRDWTNFVAEYPKFRMNDDREVRCYALLVSYLSGGPYSAQAAADEIRRLWFAQREPDDGCALAASRLIADTPGPSRLKADDAWHRARLALEAGRPRVAQQAVLMVAPDAAPQFAEINASPARFLTSKVVAFRKVRKEMVSLALIKLAASDLENAASLLDGKWGPQLSVEERDWVWGVIGKQAAQRLASDALSYYEHVSRDANLTDDMLAWKARAALRAPQGPQWPVELRAIGAMSDEARADPAWVYWKARALMARGGDERKAEASRLLRAAGARGARPENRRAFRARAADGGGKGSRAPEPGAQPCAPRDRARHP